MHGLVELAQRRMTGVKPTLVIVRVGEPVPDNADWWKYSDTYPEIYIAAHESASAIDFFPLSGLNVTIYSERVTSQAEDVIEKVQEVAQSIIFVSHGLDEVGFVWDRNKGINLLDEPWEQAA